jgi:hypothetical protein
VSIVYVIMVLVITGPMQMGHFTEKVGSAKTLTLQMAWKALQWFATFGTDVSCS